MTASITRRTALQTIVGAFMAPRITLDRSYERDMTALVSEFCGEYPTRLYDLREPWEYAGDSVASDARALIRVPGLRYVPTGEHGKIPNCDGVFASFWRDGRWRRLPRERLGQPIDEQMPCPYCSRNECAKCDGEGYVMDASLGYRCPRCNGNGFVVSATCQLCHGDRGYRAIYDVSFGAVLNARYARLVRQIPGVMWLPPIDDESPVLFRGDGGVVAMVMSINTKVQRA